MKKKRLNDNYQQNTNGNNPFGNPEGLEIIKNKIETLKRMIRYADKINDKELIEISEEQIKMCEDFLRENGE